MSHHVNALDASTHGVGESGAPAAGGETVQQHVSRLLKRWREETAYFSSATRITAHPAYVELIGLGPPALPALFRDLEQTADGHLSKALTSITGAHPVTAEDRGHVDKVAECWLRWAREHGYTW